VKALLWHAFQHGESAMFMVGAYTWKAAALIGTPINPGYSTCHLCGIAIKMRGVRPGTHSRCAELISKDVRFIIIDEISFMYKTHFAVRMCVHVDELFCDACC
jgi:hypothetical protein